MLTGCVLICPCSIFLSIPPPPLDHLSLGTKHTYSTHTAFFFFSLLLLQCQCHLSQHAGRKYSFISALSHKETIGCYTTTQQSLLCLVVDLCLGRAHTYMLSNTHTRTHKLSLSLLLYSAHRPIQSAVFFLLMLM